MKYDRECTEAAERVFLRIHGHLLAIRDRFGKLEAIDSALADENNALLQALNAGDPMEVESALFDIDEENSDGDDL